MKFRRALLFLALLVNGLIVGLAGLFTLVGFTIGPMDASYQDWQPFLCLGILLISFFAFIKLAHYLRINI